VPPASCTPGSTTTRTCPSTIAITDSGGVQEETTYLGIPCATLRENTERPVTVSEGTNRLLKPPELAAAARTALAGQWPRGRRPSHRQARRREPRQALALHGMRVRLGGGV